MPVVLSDISSDNLYEKPLLMLKLGCLSDDSLRLQAEGFRNDTGVSSHTNRSVHAQKPSIASSATDVSHGTTLAHSSIYLWPKAREREPKRYLVENVHQNSLS
jgi:hypothetical protein